jgi:hypothetical protein
MPFRERLRTEFESRRKNNPRYSMRALALFLDTDHSTLAQILRGIPRAPAHHIRRWAKKLVDANNPVGYRRIATGSAAVAEFRPALHRGQGMSFAVWKNPGKNPGQ